MRSCLAVPGGSSGDCHAIVTQFMMMTIRTHGSNIRDSTKYMHIRRSQLDGSKHSSDVLWYRRPSLPCTAGAPCCSAEIGGSFGLTGETERISSIEAFLGPGGGGDGVTCVPLDAPPTGSAEGKASIAIFLSALLFFENFAARVCACCMQSRFTRYRTGPVLVAPLSSTFIRSLTSIVVCCICSLPGLAGP